MKSKFPSQKASDWGPVYQPDGRQTPPPGTSGERSMEYRWQDRTWGRREREGFSPAKVSAQKSPAPVTKTFIGVPPW